MVSMEFEGIFAVPAPIEKVWETFMDPHGMTPCMPEQELLEILDPMRHRIVVTVGESYIKGKFDFDVRIMEAKKPTHAQLKIHGRGQGSAIDAEGTLNLIETASGTEMHWRAEAHIVGKLASVGARQLHATAEKRVNEFFECGRALLEGGG